MKDRRKSRFLCKQSENVLSLTSWVSVFGFLDKITEKRCPFGMVWQNVNTKWFPTAFITWSVPVNWVYCELSWESTQEFSLFIFTYFSIHKTTNLEAVVMISKNHVWSYCIWVNIPKLVHALPKLVSNNCTDVDVVCLFRHYSREHQMNRSMENGW